MTPQFITPCFVRVEDADKRKEILEKTADFLLPINMSTDSNYLFAFDGWVSRLYGRGLRGEQGIKELEAANFIDCGTNTELFLTLASMSSDTDKGQWFTDGEIMFQSPSSDFSKFNILPIDSEDTFYSKDFARATAQEIIEYFNGKSK